jgi:hypothetical protein
MVFGTELEIVPVIRMIERVTAVSL